MRSDIRAIECACRDDCASLVDKFQDIPGNRQAASRSGQADIDVNGGIGCQVVGVAVTVIISSE